VTDTRGRGSLESRGMLLLGWRCARGGSMAVGQLLPMELRSAAVYQGTGCVATLSQLQDGMSTILSYLCLFVSPEVRRVWAPNGQ
jgi:hypothetical protein